MTQEKKVLLEKVGIACDEAIYRFSGNEEMFERFLGKFLEDPNYEKLKEALEKKDYEEAFSAGHTLKGVTGNLAIKSVYDALIPLVEALRHKEDADYEAMMTLVTARYMEVSAAIKE
ncbi:MAG TPA: Hpt domain-containing protein [Lachnospiraceae bacterium]|jgi:histidine phosphotransfer protein HptB|nr:Hpt domain-containing protein [Lachnospiraceae bacterium]